MATPTSTYRMWKRLAGRPGGTRLFSAAAMVRVPYFASIVPHVVRMEPGLAEVTVPKWFFVYNVRVIQQTSERRDITIMTTTDQLANVPHPAGAAKM